MSKNIYFLFIYLIIIKNCEYFYKGLNVTNNFDYADYYDEGDDDDDEFEDGGGDDEEEEEKIEEKTFDKFYKKSKPFYFILNF